MALARVFVVLAVAACSSGGQPGSRSGGGSDNCYAACGFTADCDMSLMQVQECGLGIDLKLMVHPGSPCFPPVECPPSVCA